MNNRNNKSKYWVFTLNNYNENQVEALSTLVLEENNAVVYIIFGRETSASGTRHLQGYCELRIRCRFTQVIALLPNGCHVERRLGTSEEASQYCKKDGSYNEFGQISNTSPGERRDLARVQALVRQGAPLARIADEEFASFVRFGRGIKDARLVLGAQRDREQAPEVLVYWGDTGTGKTRQVYDDNKEVEIYSHPGGMWFDGYDAQPVALFDDFGGSEFKTTYLLKLLDRYPMKVPIKGSFVNWTPAKIYLTSNLDPSSWYPNAHDEHVRALRRRFTTVLHFTNLNQ